MKLFCIALIACASATPELEFKSLDGSKCLFSKNGANVDSTCTFSTDGETLATEKMVQEKIDSLSKDVSQLKDDVLELQKGSGKTILGASKAACAAGNKGELRLSADGTSAEICAIKDKKLQWTTLKGGSSKTADPDDYDTKTATNCVDLQKAGFKSSKVYEISLGKVYCDMVTDGGGWMLLLTHLDGRSQYSGSTSPFAHDKNPSAPSLTSAYSRDWAAHLLPDAGDEFLLKSSTANDWVRFEMTTTWCGWNNKGSCHGSSSHLQFAHGQLFDSSNNIVPGAIYFNGCARDGGCHASGSDGVGFGTTAGHTYFEGKCYGACWNHSYAGFYWGTKTEQAGPMTYWYRPN
jgi:hypothetical protein